MEKEFSQFTVLELVDTFSSISRYGGVMPVRLLVQIEGMIEELVRAGILRSVHVRTPEGYLIEGVRLTDLGRRLLVTR